MIHSIQCSQNPANNSREDANAEANVKIFNIGEIDIIETTGYTHVGIKIRCCEQIFLGSTGNSGVQIQSPSCFWSGCIFGDVRSVNTPVSYHKGSPVWLSSRSWPFSSKCSEWRSVLVSVLANVVMKSLAKTKLTTRCSISDIGPLTGKKLPLTKPTQKIKDWGHNSWTPCV